MKKLRSFWLLVFLFILATAIPPVVAEVSSPPPIVQVQTNPSQLIKQAGELYQAQKYQKALPLWQRAAEGYGKIGDKINSAIALGNLSLTQQKLGQWEEARSAIDRSLTLLDSSGENNSLVLAQTLDIKGKLDRETGNSQDAIASWQTAAKIYQENKDTAALKQNSLNQVRALRDLGLYPRACKGLLGTLAMENLNSCQEISQLTEAQLKERLKPVVKKASATDISALRNLGDLLLTVGQPQQSAQVLTSTIEAAKRLDSSEELSLTYLKLGNTSRALALGEEVRTNRVEYERQTIDAYNKAADLSASPATKLKAELNQFGFWLDREKWTEAEAISQSLYPQIVDNNLASRDGIYAKINYAQNVVNVLDSDIPPGIELPSKQELEKLLVDATQQAQTIGDRRIEAQGWGILGNLEEINSQYDLAESHTQKAINLISSYDGADLTYQYFWQLGRIQKQQNNTSKAIASYTKAYDALQSLRNDIATIDPEVQFSFRDRVEPVYRQLVELDVKYAQVLTNQGKKEDSKALLVQAREVVESLQIAQLNNFFREACIDANPQTIDAIDPTAAVVYPIILDDELEILLSLPDKSIRLYQSDVSRSQLETTVQNINGTLLSSVISVEELLPQYQEVYNWLIRPLEAELTQNKIKTIAFVLDGGLRNIPMSVLHDGEQYLVEKYALALTPGLQLLDPKPLTAVKLDAIAGGLSEIRKDFVPHRNFGDLPKVPEELKTIQKVGLAKRSLLNSQFTKAAIKQRITDSDSPIVHLATHAKFSSKAEDTFILSWDGQINIKDLDDLLRDDTFNRKNDIELLVLSACETASGDPRATLGLAGVAVQAGARSTLATLWSVVDESTAQMMGEFYRQLQKSTTTKANKAEVLRQAQISLIKDPKFNHPHFWSPFILVGNWQ